MLVRAPPAAESTGVAVIGETGDVVAVGAAAAAQRADATVAAQA